MGFPELAEALSQKLGTEIDPKVLNRRVNRGNFSVGFLLMCLDALGLDVQIDRMDPAKAMRPKLPKLPNKPVNAVGSIMDAWGNK